MIKFSYHHNIVTYLPVSTFGKALVEVVVVVVVAVVLELDWIGLN